MIRSRQGRNPIPSLSECREQILVDRINRELTSCHKPLALPLRNWKLSRIRFRCGHGDAA